MTISYTCMLMPQESNSPYKEWKHSFKDKVTGNAYLAVFEMQLSTTIREISGISTHINLIHLSATEQHQNLQRQEQILAL